MDKEVVNDDHETYDSPMNMASTSMSEKQMVGEGQIKAPHSPDFELRWGSRKRLRCMKTPPFRLDRRVIRSDKHNDNNAINGHLNVNLRRQAVSPAKPIHRNWEKGSVMNGGTGSPEERGEKKGSHNRNNNYEMMINVGGRTTSSEKGGTCSGSGDVVVWPPKFMIGLTNKEKEEDFLAIKGSKLPQRPKKRAKFVQRTLNLMSPGGWLCDLTLERYEVREKKISKKRPRGLKAMGNYIDSDSE